MRVVRTARGARLVEGGLVLSEVLDHPGPTHTLFDVLAATIAGLSPGPRVLLLGFAAGGVVAPLRAMGHAHPLEAVDLSRTGEQVFRSLSGPWAGRVVVHEDEASRWLRRVRRRFDLVLEDLSAPVGGETTKPAVSLDVLPALLARRVAARGLVVTNVLPVPGWPWRRLLDRLAAPWRRALVVELDDWENRVLVAGPRPPAAREASRTLRRMLEGIGSGEAGAFRVRTWKG